MTDNWRLICEFAERQRYRRLIAKAPEMYDLLQDRRATSPIESQRAAWREDMAILILHIDVGDPKKAEIDGEGGE